MDNPYEDLSEEELIALIKKKEGVGFKNPSVKEEYEALDPSVKGDIESAPSALIVTSGKRSTFGNVNVGGVPNSKHLTGNAFDVRGGLDPNQANYFKSKGYEVIPESDHIHIEKGNVMSNPYDNMTADELEAKIKELEANESAPSETSKTTSDVGIIDRFKTSFGNPQGIANYLQSKGYSSEDISNLRSGNQFADAMSLTVPGMLYNQATTGDAGVIPAAIRLANEVPQALIDTPSAVLSMMPGGTLAKQAIGHMMGTHEGPMGLENLDPEAQASLVNDIAGLGFPAAGKAAAKAEEYITAPVKRSLIESKIPERLYASVTGLGDTIAQSPEIVEGLLKNDMTGLKNSIPLFPTVDKKGLQSTAKEAMENIGAKMNEALSGKTFNVDDLTLPTSEGLATLQASGRRAEARSAAQGVMDEFGEKFPSKMEHELKSLNEEKWRLARDSAQVFQSEGAKGTYIQKAQADLSNALRPYLEMRTEDLTQGMKELNPQYNMYRTLAGGPKNKVGLEAAMSKEYKSAPVLKGGGLASQLIRGLTQTEGQRMGAAKMLYDFSRAPNVAKDMSFYTAPDMIRSYYLLKSMENAYE